MSFVRDPPKTYNYRKFGSKMGENNKQIQIIEKQFYLH